METFQSNRTYDLQEVIEICYRNSLWNKAAIEHYGFLPFVMMPKVSNIYPKDKKKMSIHPANPSHPFMSHKRKTQIRLGQPIIESPLTLVRLRHGYSRTELATLSGVPYETIAGIETGREPKIGTALKLAQALGETVESLWLKGADAKTRHEDRHASMDYPQPSKSVESPESSK